MNRLGTWSALARFLVGVTYALTLAVKLGVGQRFEVEGMVSEQTHVIVRDSLGTRLRIPYHVLNVGGRP